MNVIVFSESSNRCVRCPPENCCCSATNANKGYVWPNMTLNENDVMMHYQKPSHSSVETIHNNNNHNVPDQCYSYWQGPPTKNVGQISSHDQTQATYTSNPPHMTDEFFDPGHIFQLDQPLVRRNGMNHSFVQSYPNQYSQPTNPSNSTLLDMGSGAIGHRTYESIFGSNEDSCTTSSSQNNDGPECVYGSNGSMFQPNGTTYPAQGPMTTTNVHPITESAEILLEFQSANDRLQQKKRTYYSDGILNDNNNLMLQGNLGIYVERESIEPSCGRLEPNLDYSDNHFADYTASHVTSVSDYGQCYRVNSVNYSNNNNISESECAVQMDYATLESSAMYVNRS